MAVRLDRQAVWALGAVTQVAMVAGLLWLGLQVIGPRGLLAYLAVKPLERDSSRSTG